MTRNFEYKINARVIYGLKPCHNMEAVHITLINDFLFRLELNVKFYNFVVVIF
jgi:hypothetical protein